MDHNQILLEPVIEFPSQLLVESSDGLQEASFLLSPANQLPISNQNMVEMGKKLLEAASENNLESVRSLMTGGAPFTGNWLGTTPLHAAAKAGHIETVELLLKAGIFRDAKTKVDRTALQMAAEEGYTAIVQMLLEHGADINAKDMLRMTALHWAVERGHRDVVTVLLSHGADASVFNKFDKTAMDIACDNGFQDIVLQLEAASFQKTSKSQSPSDNRTIESVHQNTMHEMSSIKSPIWKTSPEEDALEKLTANSRNSESTSHEALKLLESHGISFLPVDNSTLLTSALESGQSIGLTEAGKMALNQMKRDTPPISKPTPQLTHPVAKKLKPSTTFSTGHPRVVTITAEQFLALAGRLQQKGKTNGASSKPMIISLPKNLGIPPQIKTISNVKPPMSENKASQLQLDPSISEYVLSQEMSDPNKNLLNSVKPNQVPLSMPILTEEEPCSGANTIIEENSSNDPDCKNIHGSSEFDLVSTQVEEVSTPSIEISPSEAMIKTNNPVLSIPANTPAENRTTDEKREHFFKSGQLKGSARTTPIAILCKKKRQKSVILEEYPVEEAMVAIHSRSTPVHQPTLNNAAPPLDAEDDMFVNDESQSCHGNNPTPVWLSIMEEENSQFSAGAADNDDDLLDPSRLAAQLASIRQAASQYSFSS